MVEPCSGVAWQRLIRDRYLSDGVPPVPHLEVGKAEVKRVSRALAERIVLKYEWLGTMHPNSYYHYGIFFGDHCAGVVCITRNGTGTAGVNGHRPYGIERNDLVLLVRGACVHWAPKGTNSRLVGRALRLLREDCPSAKLILAYVDTLAGEIGTIYQATNWIYVGASKLGGGHLKWVAPDGRVYDAKHPRNLAATRHESSAQIATELLASGWTRRYAAPKGRYVYVLDTKDRLLSAQIAAMRQPYPKRSGDGNVAAIDSYERRRREVGNVRECLNASPTLFDVC